jgi:serine phosphatase RsbU (regulator of sigma subunit)
MCALFESREPDPLPTVEPVTNEFPKIEGAEIAATTYGERVAGDFYDALRVSPQRILFGLLDVAGRRETNQEILSAAQKIFRSLGTELFAPPDINESDAMTELCLHLNRGVMEAAAGVHSCPAFIGCYHEKFGTLCYTNAGHTSGLLRDKTGVTVLASTGLPLGLFSHATSDAPIVALDKGAVLLLVSRGVVQVGSREAASKQNDGDLTDEMEFGLERVEDQLRADRSTSSAALCRSILATVAGHSRNAVVPDDMTALVFMRNA